MLTAKWLFAVNSGILLRMVLSATVKDPAALLTVLEVLACDFQGDCGELVWTYRLLKRETLFW